MKYKSPPSRQFDTEGLKLSFHHDLRKLFPDDPVRFVAPEGQKLVHCLFCAAAETVGVGEVGVTEGFEAVFEHRHCEPVISARLLYG